MRAGRACKYAAAAPPGAVEPQLVVTGKLRVLGLGLADHEALPANSDRSLPDFSKMGRPVEVVDMHSMRSYVVVPRKKKSNKVFV